MASEKQKKGHPMREKIANEIRDQLAKTRRVLGKAQEDLDEAGEERKELTPDIVDALREGLMAIYTDADEEQHEAAMQLIVEAISEAQPESDVDEERAEGDEDEEKQNEDEEEDKEESDKAYNQVAEQLTEMSKAYNDLIGDAAAIVSVVADIADVVQAKSEKENDFSSRLDAIEKTLKQRPRRASQAKETELDADSELGKAVEKQLFKDTIHPEYRDMFINGGSE
jgi:hypothetical protein